jgi:uncharacterized FlaG/YvyC family protein
VKVDLPAPVAAVAGSDPTPATNSAEEKLAQSTASPAPASTPDLSLSSAAQQPQQLSVSYQVAENGHKVYFQFIDEQTGQVVLQTPPSALLSSEEKLYQFLQEQQQANAKKGK